MSVEADASQDLRLTNRDLGDLLVEFNSASGKLKTPEELLYSFKSKGKKSTSVPALGSQAEVLFHLWEGGSAFWI